MDNLDKGQHKRDGNQPEALSFTKDGYFVNQHYPLPRMDAGEHYPLPRMDALVQETAHMLFLRRMGTNPKHYPLPRMDTS
jgi:hypothetical protein